MADSFGRERQFEKKLTSADTKEATLQLSDLQLSISPRGLPPSRPVDLPNRPTIGAPSLPAVASSPSLVPPALPLALCPRAGSSNNLTSKPGFSGHRLSNPVGNTEQEQLPSLVKLNVGGIPYLTRLSTLCKYPNSMLAVMFSGRHDLAQDDKGYYFIDSNGLYFGYILDFLRHEALPPNDVAECVYREAGYYGIEHLCERLTALPSIARRIVRDSHRSQFPGYAETKSRIIRIAMENAVVNKTGEVSIYAFRQEFVAKAPNFNANHGCAADSAHISVGPWDSLADEETFIRCLESDLIEDQFKVKCHEGKRRCKYFYGQSCQKCIFRIQIIFD